jgi:hypothetical protein
MALTNVTFTKGEEQAFLVEIPEGTLNAPKAIVTDGNSNEGALVNELHKPTVIVDNRKKVR